MHFWLRYGFLLQGWNAMSGNGRDWILSVALRFFTLAGFADQSQP
jgi:hypothetical protein